MEGAAEGWYFWEGLAEVLGPALGALDGFCEGESLGLALGRALLEGAAEGWYFWEGLGD